MEIESRGDEQRSLKVGKGRQRRREKMRVLGLWAFIGLGSDGNWLGRTSLRVGSGLGFGAMDIYYQLLDLDPTGDIDKQ